MQIPSNDGSAKVPTTAKTKQGIYNRTEWSHSDSLAIYLVFVPLDWQRCLLDNQLSPALNRIQFLSPCRQLLFKNQNSVKKNIFTKIWRLVQQNFFSLKFFKIHQLGLWTLPIRNHQDIIGICSAFQSAFYHFLFSITCCAYDLFNNCRNQMPKMAW